MIMTKMIAGVSWLLLAVSLCILSQRGLVSVGLEEDLSWGLAGGVTLASSALAGLFRMTGSFLYLFLCVAAIAFLTAFDGLNFMDVISKCNNAPTMVAQAKAGVSMAEVDRARSEVKAVEEALRQKQSEAEKEKLGLNGGKSGIGPNHKLLVAEAIRMEQELRNKQLFLAEQVSNNAKAQVETATVVANKHILSGQPVWILFAASAALEFLLAGIAWGMSAKKRVKPSEVYITENVVSRYVPTEDDEAIDRMSSIHGKAFEDLSKLTRWT